MSRKTVKTIPEEELNQLSKEQLLEIIKALLSEVARLKQSLKLDSKTSSKPPSGDILKKSEKKTQQNQSLQGETQGETKRSPGGQPGHPGKTRKGFGRVDRTEVLQPQICPSCGGTDFISEGKIEVKQVAQLVAKPIEIVEYQRHHCQCGNCGASVSAAWSDEIIPGQDLGVRLQALIGWLGNYGHLPYEKTRELLYELGQIDIGQGTLVTTNHRVARAIKKSFELLGEWVKTEQPNVHVDETPWAVKGVKEWLWIVANKSFCLFHAADTRSRTELEQILGSEYCGVLSSDDFSVYNGYPVKSQQKCLAHLRRHFLRLAQTPGRHNKNIGDVFINLIDDAFARYREFQTSNDYQQYFDWATQFHSLLKNTISQWIFKAGATAFNLLSKFRNKYNQWWYFLDHPDVPPDNNLAERALRLAVTKRKVSGGSRSFVRFQDTACLLSVVQTCRTQHRSVIGFFADALRESVGHHTTIASLIPIF